MVPRHARGAPAVFTRVEAVVVVFIAMIVLGLISSCVRTVHMGDSRTQCFNNLKQIGLAVQSFDSVFKRTPPLFGGGTDSVGNPVTTLSPRFPYENGAPHVFLLPFIEYANVYERMAIAVAEHTARIPSIPASPHQANQTGIPTFSCPVDPGVGDGIQEGSGLGGTSYAANGQLFGMTDSVTGQPLGETPWDRGISLSAIKDGTSNTILFVRAYTRCGGTVGNATTPASGTVWGYYNNGHAPFGSQGPPIFMNAVVSGNGNVGKDIKVAFQVTPTHHNTAAGCDAALPATPHSMMLILLGDGSMKGISRDILPSIWWQLCSPDDGGPIPGDL